MISSKLAQFTRFLAKIDLDEYRKRFLPIKIVEMDLPKNIQAIESLYDVYWENKRFLSFEKFYDYYLQRHKNDIETFRQKIQMCEKCFYKGLPARIYRTWASIVTQIHAGYVAESVFGNNTVSMSATLDHNGADFQVLYKKHTLNYQVKKKTHSREVRVAKKGKKKEKGVFIDIAYEVPAREYFDNPYKKNGEYKAPYLRFKKNKNLMRLKNGFVVFTSKIFNEKKKEINARSK